MLQNDVDTNIREAAETIINQSRIMMQPQMPGYDMSRTHSINLITEEFLGGYMQDGRMSVVRRFFCLFVTFDLFFVSLLWLICIMINGDNISIALQKQIIHYTIYTSLFDVVAVAICRFIILTFFYAFLYTNHWFIIAFSTSASCLFLISKVFAFDWVDSKDQVFEVILIITSFVLSWGEAWFLDCRVIPQERHARTYFSSLSASVNRTPMIAPFLTTPNLQCPSESTANFYSLLDSAHNSDCEDEQDEEYHQMGLDCVRKAYNLLQCSDWKVEKVTKKGDTISSTQRDKLGKIYKMTGRLKYPPKALCKKLFYSIENQPEWNPTLLESKIIRKINSYTDITYQATVGGAGGIIKNRDFVNLRCVRLFHNGKVCNDLDDKQDDEESSNDEYMNRSYEGSVSTISEFEDSETPLPGSVGSCRTNNSHKLHSETFTTLSKSLGAKDFRDAVQLNYQDSPPLDEEYEDAKENLDNGCKSKSPQVEINEQQTSSMINNRVKGKVWISAAVSVPYNKIPATSKYTRGENLITAFAWHQIDGKPDACIYEWIICLDLKGFIPRYILDTAYTTFMNDYMSHLRKYINELRQRHHTLSKK